LHFGRVQVDIDITGLSLNTLIFLDVGPTSPDVGYAAEVFWPTVFTKERPLQGALEKTKEQSSKTNTGRSK
jgi:hypothetical protein